MKSPVIELPLIWILILNAAGWPFIQFSLAWIFTRMPVRWFQPRRVFGWELDGRIYEKVCRIKLWKHRLPDGAGWFGGGFAKGTLLNQEEGYLRRFVQETRRGELCHWAALMFAPVFFLWNPLWADVVMVAYAAAANLPCILVQRYNRARIQRLLTRGSRDRRRCATRGFEGRGGAKEQQG